MKLATEAFVFGLVLILTPTMSFALIYDDFSSKNIDLSLWSETYPQLQIFSQSDGYLNADGGGDKSGYYGTLTSTTKLTGDFQLTVKFDDFYADGISIGDRPSIQLFISSGSAYFDSLYIERYFWEDGFNETQGFISKASSTFQSKSAYSTSGLMKISRIGSEISTMYNEGEGWIELGSQNNSWVGELTFGLEVYTTDGGPFHVGIDYINIDDNSAPIPEPSTILLLVLGLAGVARYYRQKSSKLT